VDSLLSSRASFATSSIFVAQVLVALHQSLARLADAVCAAEVRDRVDIPDEARQLARVCSAP